MQVEVGDPIMDGRSVGPPVVVSSTLCSVLSSRGGAAEEEKLLQMAVGGIKFFPVTREILPLS